MRECMVYTLHFKEVKKKKREGEKDLYKFTNC